MKEISAVKGMHDILPKDIIHWHIIEKTWNHVINSYCYDEIRFPIVEKLDLFYSSIGEQTDIISKEIFNFPDRNNINLALRPEGTAGCTRAIVNNNLIYKKNKGFGIKVICLDMKTHRKADIDSLTK
jgi:histidyl-tRNA synthetase